MKLNITHKLRQDKDKSCAVISAIFACKIREAIISLLAPLRRSLNRADAEKEMSACWSRAVVAVTVITETR